MNMSPVAVYCDGLCEPKNPGGWACYGWAVMETERSDDTSAPIVLAHGYGSLGKWQEATNNRAEYYALISALSWLARYMFEVPISVFMDSQLVVNQIKGLWRVKSPNMVPLHRTASILMRMATDTANTHSYPLSWVGRELNTYADALSRRAYDYARRKPPPHVFECWEILDHAIFQQRRGRIDEDGT